jgi:hypothetical protein
VDKIFVSRRETDAPFAAAYIAGKLRERFDADCGGTPSSGDLPGSAAVVAVIGPRWLAPQCDDAVRLEIAWAQRNGVPVVPVLVEGAELPAASDLPADIAALAGQPALRVGPDGDGLQSLQDALAGLPDIATVMAVDADGAAPAVLRAEIHAAITAARLDLTVQDREHGAAVLAPGGAAPITLVSRLIPALQARVAGLGRIGIAVDEGGHDAVLRLLAAPSLAQIFAASRSTRLAVLVSGTYYRDVVGRNYEAIDASVFGPVRAGPAPGEVAWAWVPGTSAPPRSVLTARPEARDSGTGGAGTNVNYGTVNGDMVAGSKVMGDKHVYYRMGGR